VRACGLNISIPKTKFLVAGRNIIRSNLDSIPIGGGNIEPVSSFRYLGSVVKCHGGVSEKLSVRVSSAAAVFGALHRSVFSDGSLSILTKGIVYKAVVLGVLYAGLLSRGNYIHSLEVFHHHCLRTILGVSRAQQIAQHISNEDVRGRMGMPLSLGYIISSCRLCWLSHLGRTCDSRLPKQMLFGWLPQSHPPHGVKPHRRDG